MILMKVTARNYTHEFRFFSDHEIFFDRHQLYPSNYSITDVYGSFWSFMFANIAPGALCISQGESSLAISGTVGVLIPPQSAVHWKINCPQLHWFCYSNNEPYPESFPLDLTIYPLHRIPDTVSPAWIKELIIDSKNSTTLQSFGINPYAKKFKILLDREFKLNKALPTYAVELGLSKEWLIKYFKKSYHLTPVDYRNKKRMMEALFLLHVETGKIIDLSQSIGFNDLKHFNQLFKKAISVPPSKFLSKNHF